jgi:hypothetical protein
LPGCSFFAPAVYEQEWVIGCEQGAQSGGAGVLAGKRTTTAAGTVNAHNVCFSKNLVFRVGQIYLQLGRSVVVGGLSGDVYAALCLGDC